MAKLIENNEMKGIQLKEGQTVLDVDGNEYLIEKGDVLREHSELKEGRSDETTIAIRQILKDKFNLTSRQVSVRQRKGGYSSSIDVTIKHESAIKYMDDIENLTKNLQRYTRDERTQEILAGGNLFIFVKIDFDLQISLEDEYRDEITKLGEEAMADANTMFDFNGIRFFYDSSYKEFKVSSDNKRKYNPMLTNIDSLVRFLSVEQFS